MIRNGDKPGERRLALPIHFRGPTRCLGVEGTVDDDYNVVPVGRARACVLKDLCIRYRDREDYGPATPWYSECPYDWQRMICTEYQTSWRNRGPVMDRLVDIYAAMPAREK